MREVVVLGATSLIGHFLLPRLSGEGYRVRAVSRARHAPLPGIEWVQCDITVSSDSSLLGPGSTVISLVPIWALTPWLERLPSPPARLLAFSSTSIHSKATSTSATERALAERLRSGELALQAHGERRGMGWDIFRPTMIYGAGRDQNVSFIARFIQQRGFFPLLGTASGLRSPVHADDLAQTVIRCLQRGPASNRAYDLMGGDQLSYRMMVGRIFKALGKNERFLPIPAALARPAIRLARCRPGWRHLTPEMVDRMAVDLIYDDSEARRDFGHQPRPFWPRRQDLLPDVR